MTRTKVRIAAVATGLVAVLAGTAVAADSGPAVPDVSEVRGLFDTWNAALATGDAQSVAALYAEDGVLLSTLSSDIREGREEIADYFEADFLPKQPQGVVTESHVVVIDEEHVLHSGLYDFTVVVDGESSVVPARFSYAYELVDGDWLITSHHSSVQPTA